MHLIQLLMDTLWVCMSHRGTWQSILGMRLAWNGFKETDLIQNFRMFRATFDYICQCVSTRLSWWDTRFRLPISLRRCGLYWLAIGADCQMLSGALGIAASSICSTFASLCAMPDYIKGALILGTRAHFQVHLTPKSIAFDLVWTPPIFGHGSVIQVHLKRWCHIRFMCNEV